MSDPGGIPPMRPVDPQLLPRKRRSGRVIVIVVTSVAAAAAPFAFILLLMAMVPCTNGGC